MTHDDDTILTSLVEASDALESAWNVEISSTDWLRSTGQEVHDNASANKIPRKTSSTLNAFQVNAVTVGSGDTSQIPVKYLEKKKSIYPFTNTKSSKEESLAPWIPLSPGHSNSLSTNAFSCNYGNNETKSSNTSSSAGKQHTPKSKKYALPSFYSSKSKNSRFSQQRKKGESTEVVFQHHTDLSRYMSEYRQQKLEKMARDYNLEEKLQETRSASDILSSAIQPAIPSACIELPGNLAKLFSDPPTLYQHNSTSHNDNNSERSSGSPTGVQHATKRNQSPIKVRGGKCLLNRDNKKSTLTCTTFSAMTIHEQPKSTIQPLKPPSNTYLAVKGEPNTSKRESTGVFSLQTEDILQCRKLTDANDRSNQNGRVRPRPLAGHPTWRPQPILSRLQTHSSPGKDKRLPSNDLDFSNYRHMIKQFVEQYDPTGAPNANKSPNAKPSSKLPGSPSLSGSQGLPGSPKYVNEVLLAPV